jgi:hypothetical protein
MITDSTPDAAVDSEVAPHLFGTHLAVLIGGVVFAILRLMLILSTPDSR